MKKISLLYISAALIGVLLLCTASKPDYGYGYYYTPYFITRAELNQSVSYVAGAKEMLVPGKIYARGSEIFINEKYKGVHIIDNSDPANPVATGFIIVPGCLDMAVRDNIIYLDNSIDLVAFDLDTKQVLSRVKNCLDEPCSPTGSRHYGSRPVNGIIAGWKKKEAKYYYE